MKKRTATICKATSTFVTGIALAVFLYAGTSCAENNDQEIKNGTIRVEQNECKYADLAQITLKQAHDFALELVPGKIVEIELKAENGFLIYDVEIVTPDKMITEVKVDAGSGEILLLEKDTADDDNEEESRN